jgi:AcrR family transcriptional regulator
MAAPDDIGTKASPKPGLRAQKLQARKDHILTVAARLFAERGYHAVSVDEIGTASGMSGPAMYKYFKDKSAILTSILDYGSRVAKQAIAAIDTTNLTDREILDERVKCYIEFTGRTRDALVVAVREANSIPDWYRPEFMADQRAIREAEVNLLLRLRPALSRADARYICSSVFQGLISSSAYLYPADNDARKKALTKMATAALLA